MGSLDLPDRFWSNVEFEPNSGCWLWSGYVNHDGYGRVQINGKQTMVHRATFGVVPDGTELDHKCRVRSCCNPDHLDPVPHSENVRRGELSDSNRRRGQARTHCSHGHLYDEHNTGINADGSRRCKTCHADRSRESRRRTSSRAS